MVFVTSITRGLSIGAAGVAAGVLAAWVSVRFVNEFVPIRLDSSVYWVETLTGRFSTQTALAASVVTLLVCLLVSVAPAVSALADSPSEALRYE
jgi:ABC-type lipoprotein release transport system permease subunit